ncbi:MAG TPA: potassium channel family protein, partial [Solirubrobacteraceae bacterium]|nr:potassium channel family protein [Solirubrobacteraceae bacterium]
RYFAQVSHAAVTQSQEIYFSFSTLTTTGYGDLTPALNVGRALSVLEMLTGQIYLVTVIGLLVANMRRRTARAPEA